MTRSQIVPMRYEIAIDRTTLARALQQAAKQLGLQFAGFSEFMAPEVMVGPLHGLYTRQEGLDLLLQGSGLTYQFINDRTVAIVKLPAAAGAAENPQPPTVSAEQRPPP